MVRARARSVDTPGSVLDLLLEDTRPMAQTSARSRDPFGDAIARDLHMLLNTRRMEQLLPAGFEQCSTSILNFGLPDLTHCGALNAPAEQIKVCRWLEEAIRTFEPRLRSISVRLVDSGSSSPFLRFRLEAHADFLADRVSFEMNLKRDTGELSVLPR